MITSEIIIFMLVVISASIMTGFLSDFKYIPKVVEGFNADDKSVNKLNYNLSEKVTQLEDKLHISKYKDSYKQTLKYGGDYLEATKLSCLFDLKEIIKNQDNTKKVLQESANLGRKLSALNKGAITLETTQL